MNIRRISNVVSQIYDECLKPSGLTVCQYSLLSHLETLSTASITELAKEVGLDRTTLVRNLNPLIKYEFVKDTAAPGTRKRALQVTEQGIRAISAARPLWEKAQQILTEKIGVQHVEVLREIVIELGE